MVFVGLVAGYFYSMVVVSPKDCLEKSISLAVVEKRGYTLFKNYIVSYPL